MIKDYKPELSAKCMKIVECDTARIRKFDSDGMLFLIIGFNQMGKSLLIQAARMSHFANQEKLKVTILDKSINAMKRLFLKSYPQLHNVIDLDFQELNIEGFNADVFNKIQGEIPVTCSYLCLFILAR